MLLQLVVDHSRLHLNGEVAGIKFRNAVHIFQAEHSVHRFQAQPDVLLRAAAPGNDGRLRFIGSPEDIRYLLG